MTHESKYIQRVQLGHIRRMALVAAGRLSREETEELYKT